MRVRSAHRRAACASDGPGAAANAPMPQACRVESRRVRAQSRESRALLWGSNGQDERAHRGGVLTVTLLWPNIPSEPATRGQGERVPCRDEEVATTAMAEETGASAAEAAPAPEGRPASRRVRHGEVRVFGNWCKGCGLCIAFCPRNVFVAGSDGHPLAVYPERCTACMWCTEHCPDFAIVVQPSDNREEVRRDAA